MDPFCITLYQNGLLVRSVLPSQHRHRRRVLRSASRATARIGRLDRAEPNTPLQQHALATCRAALAEAAGDPAAAVATYTDAATHGVAAAWVQPCCGFVEEDEPRPPHQGHCEVQAALHAAGIGGRGPSTKRGVTFA